MKLEEYRKQLARDPEYLAAQEELRPLLELADTVLSQRLSRDWSQAELAERVGTRQANISRLESGLANPSVRFLQKVANAFGETLTIELRPHPTLASKALYQRAGRVAARPYLRTEQQASPAIRESSAEWLASQPGSSELGPEADQDELHGAA